MLFIFLSHIIITVVSLCTGFLFYETLSMRKPTNFATRPIVFYLISGLIFTTTLFQLVVLFAPINLITQSIALCILCLLLYLKRKPFSRFVAHVFAKLSNLPSLFFFSFGCIWLLLVFLNAGPTLMDDTESYHIQMIKWIKEYGTVPGLVHMHERFGFNSSWFTSIALFIPSSGNLNYYTTLNGVLSLWLSGYVINTITSKHALNLKLSASLLVVLVICSISWPLLRGNVSTSNYDYITLLIIFVLFTESFKQETQLKIFPLLPEWFIWSAYLFTVRITNFPILFLGLFAVVLMYRRRENKLIIACCIFTLFLVLPFLARNVILTGYAFYPSMYFDWFSVDWKANKETTMELLRFIKYYNRVSTGFVPLESTASMGLGEWPKSWFKYMFSYDKIIFIPGIIGILTGYTIIRKIKPFDNYLARVFILIIIFQIFCWFVIAPDPRFVYGCLLIGILLLSYFFIAITKVEIKHSWPSLGLLILSLALAGFAIFKIKSTSQLNFWTPFLLPQPPTKIITIDNTAIHVPEKILNNWNPRCYSTELPCAYEVDPRVRKRGTNIKSGFRLKD